MKLRILPLFLALVMLSGCVQSDTAGMPAGEKTPVDLLSEEPDGRYSNETGEAAELEKEILEIPEIVEYSQRELVLPEPVLEEQEQTVTVMVYMVGSDLESKSGAATKDMEEMRQSGVDFDRVNLLLYTGGCEKWFSDIDGENNCIYQMTAEGLVKLKEYKSQSMGDPTCLSTFLNWSYNNFKTDSYNLILWNHGNGPVMGYGKDRLFEGDSLSLQELEQALSASPFKDENKFGFIGFDACLMSSAELACMMSDYAEYLVASQEVEPNFGWNYSFLKDCGKLTNRSLAQQVVYEYITACNRYFEENPDFCNDVTLACIDLSGAQALEESMNALFDVAMNDVSGAYNTLAMERYQSRAFGRATTGSEYDLVDLNSLMNSMAESYSTKVSAVQSVIEQMVYYSGYNTTDCCGMSIYYPYFNKKFYSSSWKEGYREINRFSSYHTYLDRFEQIWLGTDMMALFTEPLTPEEFTPGCYMLTLSDEQMECFQSAGYYILRQDGDGLYSVVSYDEDVTVDRNTIIANYDGRTLMVGDDYGNKFTLDSYITEVKGNDYYHTVSFVARDTVFIDHFSDIPFQTAPAEIQLIVNHETNQVTPMGYFALPSEEENADTIHGGKKNPLDLNQLPVFALAAYNPKYPQRNQSGRMLPIDQWLDSGITTRDILSSKNGIHFTYEPLYDDGRQYFLMFDVADTGENHYCSELMPISVAKAPEQEKQEEVVNNFRWSVQEAPPYIESGNVDLYPFEVKDPTEFGKDVYGVTIKNNGKDPIYVQVKDLVINDGYQINNRSMVQYESDAIYSGFLADLIFTELESTLRLAGMEELRRLQFTYRISNYQNGEILVDWTNVNLDMDEGIEPQLACTDFYGVHIPDQNLMDEKGLRVELEDAGRYPATGNNNNSRDILSIRLKLNNTSELTQYFRPKECIVNGISVNLTNMSYNKPEVYPQDESYMILHTDRIPTSVLTGGIQSLELMIDYCEDYPGESNSTLVLPLNIVSANSSSYSIQDYPCVYEDDYIRILDQGPTANYIYTDYPRYRCIIIQNKTEERIRLEASNVSKGCYHIIGTIYIEPGCSIIKYIECRASVISSSDRIQFGLEVRKDDIFDSETYEIPIIQLDAIDD